MELQFEVQFEHKIKFELAIDSQLAFELELEFEFEIERKINTCRTSPSRHLSLSTLRTSLVVGVIHFRFPLRLRVLLRVLLRFFRLRFLL